jgi:hypothetical protein
VQLGLENKKKTVWAAALGVLAIVAVAYQFLPMLTESSAPGSNAQAAAPTTTEAPREAGHVTGKAAKKLKQENLDPTLRLDLLAMSEQTQYAGTGRNIFVSQAEVEIPQPKGSGRTDAKGAQQAPVDTYHLPPPPPPTPIPLKFFGFASKPGEPKQIFLSDTSGENVWVAGEGEIVNRRYKVIHISPTSVQIQDVVNSGPPQNIPLTQG